MPANSAFGNTDPNSPPPQNNPNVPARSSGSGC
ncbi:MAG: hypothetical protein ACI9HK_003516, partial [Pirellulaceae bacterium]